MKKTLLGLLLLAGCAKYGRPVYEVEQSGMNPRDFAMVTLEVWGMT